MKNQKNNARVILGLSALGHDPSACLFVDGVMTGAVEEERLIREKNTTKFPYESIRYVLQQQNLSFSDIDLIAYYWDDKGKIVDTFFKTMANGFSLSSITLAFNRLKSFNGPKLLRKKLSALCDNSEAELPPIYYADHHKCHVMAGIYSSPEKVNGALVIDGRGEYASTSIFSVNGDEIKKLEETVFPNSLGVFYGAVTQLLGEKALADEYKIMGLASYGKENPKWVEKLSEILKVDEYGYHCDLSYFERKNCSQPTSTWFSKKALDLLEGNFKEKGLFTQDAKDLAYAAQKLLENACIGLLRKMKNKYGITSIVISGGVAMNATMIGGLREKRIMENIHVPLAPYDAGCSIGAAVIALRERGIEVCGKNLINPYLGPNYSDDEIEQALTKLGCSYVKCDNIYAEIAKELANDKMVGWFCHRLEYGARALGARSILGNPNKESMRDNINNLVKRREVYRPLAPAILEEVAGEYFEITDSRLMNCVTKAKAKAKEVAPAIVHIDGTARPQTVAKDTENQDFRLLLEHFYNLTGVPMLINTSFNIKDESIVCSPEDALRSFTTTGLDIVAIGNFMVKKEMGDE